MAQSKSEVEPFEILEEYGSLACKMMNSKHRCFHLTTATSCFLVTRLSRPTAVHNCSAIVLILLPADLSQFSAIGNPPSKLHQLIASVDAQQRPS
jgi:hypothetical protein